MDVRPRAGVELYAARMGRPRGRALLIRTADLWLQRGRRRRPPPRRWQRLRPALGRRRPARQTDHHPLADHPLRLGHEPRTTHDRRQRSRRRSRRGHRHRAHRLGNVGDASPPDRSGLQTGLAFTTPPARLYTGGRHRPPPHFGRQAGCGDTCRCRSRGRRRADPVAGPGGRQLPGSVVPPSASAMSWVTSLRLPPATVTLCGMPAASVIRCLLPSRPRSTRAGTGAGPL